MNTRTSNPSYEDLESELTRSLRAGVACIFMIALLALAACGEGGTAVIKDAVAAPADAATAYFPTQFPSPEGAPTAHIEAF